MPKTYEPIATQTLGSATATVTFSSIPGTYTDLILIANVKRTAGSDIEIQLNGDTGSNYSFTYLYGTGSATGSGRASDQTKGNIGYSGTTSFTTQIVQFMNYSNTTTNKTFIGRNSPADAGDVSTLVNLYRSTSAITSILLDPNSGNLDTGSTFTLYGIKSA
jgi:hypothetical protein